MKKQYTNFEAAALCLKEPGHKMLDNWGAIVEVDKELVIRRGGLVNGKAFSALNAPFTDPNEPEEIELSEEFKQAHVDRWKRWYLYDEIYTKALFREFIRLVKLELKK